MTEQEEAGIKQEIANLESRYEKAVRECFYIEAQIFRLKCQLDALSPEKCSGITKLIGNKLPGYKPTGE